MNSFKEIKILILKMNQTLLQFLLHVQKLVHLVKFIAHTQVLHTVLQRHFKNSIHDSGAGGR